MRKVIVNSTPLIALCHVKQLVVLKQLYGEITIPKAVYDEISVKENKTKKAPFVAVKETRVVVPKWLEFSPEKLSGKIVALPVRDDIDLNIEEHLIVELYSK